MHDFKLPSLHLYLIKQGRQFYLALIYISYEGELCSTDILLSVGN